MIIDIPDEEFKEAARKAIIHNINKNTMDNLQYWVRNEVHKILAKDVVKTIIEKHFTEDNIRKLVKESVDRVIEEKFYERD